MKVMLLAIERAVLGLSVIRWPVIALDRLLRRILWIWGRVRFGAMVKDRGNGCVCHWNADLKVPDNISVGHGVVIGVNVSIGAASRVRIGDQVRISRDVMIETAGLDFETLAPPYLHISSPINIERGVWIGARALILGGVTVGEYCVIAAGSVVTKTVPPFSLVAGVPATVVRRINVSSHAKSP